MLHGMQTPDDRTLPLRPLDKGALVLGFVLSGASVLICSCRGGSAWCTWDVVRKAWCKRVIFVHGVWRTHAPFAYTASRWSSMCGCNAASFLVGSWEQMCGGGTNSAAHHLQTGW